MDTEPHRADTASVQKEKRSRGALIATSVDNSRTIGIM